MLKTQDITYQYPGSDLLRFPDMDIADDAHCLILGQSGCGKTTLLHLLGGLLRPKSGSIQIQNTDIAQLSSSQVDQYRGKHIGMVFQQSHFVRALTVLENLSLAQSLSGNRVEQDRIRALAERLNLGHKLGSYPQEMSVGEQQRAAIARALVNRPEIILADEPTSALDDDNCEEVVALLKSEASHAGATLIIVTHDNRLKDIISQKVILEK